MTDVVTGEAVVLDLPVANFPSRMAALGIDMLVQLVLYLGFGIAIVVSIGALNDDYVAAIWLSLYVAVVIGYPTAFETLSRGKTLGKMALGLRVVSDDGGPVRFRQALIRALVGLFEIWTLALTPVALITSIVSAKGKRVGDMFAGTYVLQERMPHRTALPAMFSVVPPPLAGWAQTLEVARLSGPTADAAGSYLRRLAELSPQARDLIGVQLANAVAAQVSPAPPPGTPPAAYLSAVLAVRRAREQARFMAMHPPAAPTATGQAPAPGTPLAPDAPPAPDARPAPDAHAVPEPQAAPEAQPTPDPRPSEVQPFAPPA